MDNFTNKIQMLIDVAVNTDGDEAEISQAAMNMNLTAADIVLAAEIIEAQTLRLLGPATVH